MFLGEDGDGVGSNLVGDVTVGGDAVGSDHDGTNLALLHHGPGHVVRNHRGRDAVFHQFPRSEPRALQEGARFVRVNVNLLALLDRRPDHAQRGAISRGGERARIAVGKHSALGRHESGAMASHGLVGGNILGVHVLRFFDQRLLDLWDRANADALKLLLHAADRPEKIYSRGPRLADYIASLIEVTLEIASGFGLRIFHSQRNAHCRGHADGGRSTHDHGANDVGDLLMRRAGNVGLFRRQLRLINEAYAPVSPFEGLNHK